MCYRAYVFVQVNADCSSFIGNVKIISVILLSCNLPNSGGTTMNKLFLLIFLLASSVREIHLSLVGHFVQRTSTPSPDILNSRQTFHCNISSNIHCNISISNFSLDFYSADIVRDFLLSDKMPGKIKPLRRTFSKFAGHVRRVPRISRTLRIGTTLGSCGVNLIFSSPILGKLKYTYEHLTTSQSTEWERIGKQINMPRVG